MIDAVTKLLRVRAGFGSLRRLEGADRTLAVGTAGTLALNVAQTLLSFAVTFSLSRLLGADGVGAYVYAFAWASLLAVPSVLGLTPLVVRNVAAYREREEWGLLRGLLARANAAVMISSALLVTGGASAALIVNGSEPELLYPVLVGLLLVPIVALTSIRQAAMQGLGRVVVGRIPETLIAPAIFLALIGIAYGVRRESPSVTAVVALQNASFIVTLAVGAVLLRKALPQHAKTERAQHAMGEWIRSALPLLLFSGIQALNAQVDVILLGAIKGSSEAGVFAVAGRIATVVAFLMLAVSYPAAPLIARLHASGQTELLRRTVRRAALAIFLASLPIACGVFVFARQLLAIFGDEFQGGVTTLIMLAAAQLVFVATGFAGTVLVMTGHESLLVRGVVVGVTLTIGLNAVLIPAYGRNGAAAASLIGFTVMNVFLAYLARQRAGVPSTAFRV